jgi:hypothetical protein
MYVALDILWRKMHAAVELCALHFGHNLQCLASLIM